MENDPQPPLYAWKPLSHHKSIRVLTLHPCRETSSIDVHVTLSEVQLSEPVPETLQYEALSYCWATEDGDDSRSQVIYCDGAQILITKNCEAALRRLRTDEDRILWIDAICINQSDDQERSSQVNRMQLIYTYASSVKVYLGEPLDDVDESTNERISDTTVNFLAALHAELKDSGLPEKDAEGKCPLYQGLSAVLYSATPPRSFHNSRSKRIERHSQSTLVAPCMGCPRGIPGQRMRDTLGRKNHFLRSYFSVLFHHEMDWTKLHAETPALP